MPSCVILAMLALCFSTGFSAEGGGTTPLIPWRPGSDQPPAGSPDPGQAQVAGAAPAPVTLSSVTKTIMAPMKQDGTADIAELQEMLQAINRQVNASIVIPKERPEGNLVANEAPLQGPGWRLWVFWGINIPEIEGLASALVRVRGSGLASVKPVHVASMRHWEAWIFRMNDYREAQILAAKAQDQQKCDTIGAAWKAEVAPFNEMIHTFYRRGVGVMPDLRAAVTLRVETIPCFRLVSPSNRIHSLDGFGPGFDLVEWICRCQAWEAEFDRKGGSP